MIQSDKEDKDVKTRVGSTNISLKVELAFEL
jgi:hypothetical protein